MSYFGADGKPIAVGDMVMLVKPRPCCGSTQGLGKTGVVVGPANKFRTATCYLCLAVFEDMSGFVAIENHKGESVGEASRLKRIPPPEELGLTDEREELKEPA